MAFTLPQFNIVIYYWEPGHLPSTDPYDQQTVGQLFLAKEAAMVNDFNASVWNNDEVIVEWRLPQSTEGLFGTPMVGGIISRIGAYGTTWYYKIVAWENKHKEFPNAYLVLFCSQCDDAGVAPDSRR